MSPGVFPDVSAGLRNATSPHHLCVSLTFGVPATVNVRVPVLPLTSDRALSKLLLFCRQLYSTSVFHSALSPGERTSWQKKGLWRRSEARGSFLRAGGWRGKTGWDGTDRSEALQHGGKEDLNKNASNTVTYLELSSACQTKVFLLRFPIGSYWFVFTFFICLFLPFLHLHSASSAYLSAPALPRSATPLPNDSDQ